MKPSPRRARSLLVGLVFCAAAASPARADDDAQPRTYRFRKVADSFEDGFVPFSFECLSINNHGELAFLATFDDPRVPDGVRIGVYRATPRSGRR